MLQDNTIKEKLQNIAKLLAQEKKHIKAELKKTDNNLDVDVSVQQTSLKQVTYFETKVKKHLKKLDSNINDDIDSDSIIKLIDEAQSFLKNKQNSQDDIAVTIGDMHLTDIVNDSNEKDTKKYGNDKHGYVIINDDNSFTIDAGENSDPDAIYIISIPRKDDKKPDVIKCNKKGVAIEFEGEVNGCQIDKIFLEEKLAEIREHELEKDNSQDKMLSLSELISNQIKSVDQTGLNSILELIEATENKVLQCRMNVNNKNLGILEFIASIESGKDIEQSNKSKYFILKSILDKPDIKFSRLDMENALKKAKTSNELLFTEKNNTEHSNIGKSAKIEEAEGASPHNIPKTDIKSTIQI
jgi:hypothetical protein